MAKEDRELLEEIKERYADADTVASPHDTQFKRDMKFRYGEQWDDVDLRRRKERGRPCLVFNRTNATIRQITNDQRQNSPSPEVIPVDDNGDIKTAEVIQGMIRYILNLSNSKSAFTTAFEHSVTGGRGFFRIHTEYASDKSFDQDIKIKRIIDPSAVRFDPLSTEIDGSDAEFAFVGNDISKDKFKREFKKSDLSKIDSWSPDGNPFILNDKTVRIAEYFYAAYTPKTLLLLSNGDGVFEDELDQDWLAYNKLKVIEGRTRQVDVRSIKWCKTNGVEILDRTDWAGIWIPIIPVYGEQYFLDGKMHLRGMVADSRDPQMAFNALESTGIEAIALAPKAPWLVTPENIEGFKSIWDHSNDNLPYLPFNLDKAGHIPSRNSVEPPIAAITQSSLQMSENLKAVTGMYDAALGARSNETSGIAIERRRMQGDTANFHFQDHQNASISHCGVVLADLIPRIYDARRAVRILGNEDEIKTVIVNQQNPNGDGLIYDLAAAKYDVRTQSGPSYLTKRQAAASSMLELSKGNPQFMSVAGDLAVKSMDLPHSQEIAERIRRTIPPNILGEDAQGQIPPEVQAQLTQMHGVIQNLSAELEKAKNPIVAKQMELESKERIETLKAQTDVEIKKMELEANVGDIQAAFQTVAQQLLDLRQRMAMLDQGMTQQAAAPAQQFPPQNQFQNGGGLPLGPQGQPVSPPEFQEQPTFPTGGLSPG